MPKNNEVGHEKKKLKILITIESKCSKYTSKRVGFSKFMSFPFFMTKTYNVLLHEIIYKQDLKAS